MQCDKNKKSKKIQRIVLIHLSNFFGTRLVVPEYCIDKLGHNHIIPHCDFFLSDGGKDNFGPNL